MLTPDSSPRCGSSLVKQALVCKIMSPTKGIFLAPVIGSFVATLVFCFTPGVQSHQVMGVLFTYSLVGAVFGWFSALIFGWPLTTFFNKYNLNKMWQYAVGGTLCALPFTFLWLSSSNNDYRETYGIGITFYFLNVGLVSGITYWALVIGKLHTNKSLNQIGANNAPPG